MSPLPTPPPPPPKPSSHATSRLSTPQNGRPPLPPPPPSQTSHDTTQPQHRYDSQPPEEEPSGASLPLLPPGLEDGWLPAAVQDKSKPDLVQLLTSPHLLAALSLPPPSTPPLPHLTVLLTHSLSLATTLTHLSTHLTTLRASTSTHLLHLHALERQWRQKQAQVDDALAPFAPKALHQRLGASIAEQEAYVAALEESFLEGEGRAGEREVGQVVKRWREGRRVLEVRRERRERWEEGRVGGWR
ncbi:hypothetical protein MMC34_003736 [Xylographa carneopallida]|nr:hypothetical protein [Xylographa carneopallida]